MNVKDMVAKSNEQFLSDIHEGKIPSSNILNTPYANLHILLDTREMDNSYRDEDGDWIHSTKIVVVRKAFLKYEEGHYSFLFDNWFDDIDNFEIGLYAKVRLGDFYNLVTPSGEYLFHHWHEDIEFCGNNLICCHGISQYLSYNQILIARNNENKYKRICDICDRRGRILLQDVLIKTDFTHGKAIIISKEGLYNYIDKEGEVLSKDWYLDARPFELYREKLYAFVRTKDGWGVINQTGDYVYPPCFDDIVKAEWASYSFRGESIAIVVDGDGQNILMCGDNDANHSSRLILGFQEVVESIILVGEASRILAKVDGEWFVYEWDNKQNKFQCSLTIGVLDNVESELIQISYSYYRLVKKDNLFNLVSTRGITFDEWYSEIEIYGNLFKVKRIVKTTDCDSNDKGDVKLPNYEFNLISSNGSCILEEWVDNMSVIPFEEFFIVNIKPNLVKAFNGNIYDNSIIREQDQSSGKSKIKRIQGLCNIFSDSLLFNNWFEGIEFLDGQMFAGGYLKVWNNGQCNLIDKKGELVSPEWVDDFVISRWNKTSYFCNIKQNSFLVERDNKLNILYNGKFLFNQWFTEIKRINWSRSSDVSRKKESYAVQDGYLSGIYDLEIGLVGGRLYDTIKRISDSLYFCRFDNKGHIMSLEGKVITTSTIEDVQPFKDGYAMVTTKEIDSYGEFQYNFINSEGSLVSPVWFDGDRYLCANYSENGQSAYMQVRKDSKYNLLTSEKQLVFKKWYDSIGGEDGRWLIKENSRGEYKYNFIDVDETLLMKEWFKDVESSEYLDDGIYIVETDQGFNILNEKNELTLTKCSKECIYRDSSSRLLVLVDRSEYKRRYYYINRKGYMITPYWSDEDSAQRSYCNIGDKYEDILIIKLNEDKSDGGQMKIICKSDGTPFFKDAIPRTFNPFSTINDDYLTSIFGKIEEYYVPEKGPVLLVDKHWPTKYGDVSQYVILDYKGQELSGVFDKINNFDDDGFAVVEKDGKFNIINKHLHVISSLWFDNLGYEYKSKETEYSEYMDYETGRIDYSPYRVEKIRRHTSFNYGLLKVELSGLFNLMDQSGRIQFPIWYDSLNVLPYGYYKVGLNGLYNVVNASHKPLMDVWSDKIGICKRNYEQTIYGCRKGDLHRLLFIRESSVVLSEDWFDKVAKYDKSDGYYSVRLNGKKNFVTDDGKLLVKGWHDDQLLFIDYNGVFVVVQDDEKFNIYSSRQSKFISENGFDKVIRSEHTLFNCGWCGVQIEGKYTFVNEDGILAEGRYDMIHNFKYGFAGVLLDGKKNYITSEGMLLSDVWFEEISAFSRSKRAVVKINGKYNIIDSTGALLLSDTIQNIASIGPIESEYFKLSLNSDDGKIINKYCDFKTEQLHDTEKQVKGYLEGLKVEVDKEIIDSTIDESIEDNIDGNSAVIKSNKQIRQLIESNGKTGINYTLVTFGSKLNLVDKDGALVFEEWIDSPYLKMYQGVPLVMNADSKWIIVK